MDLCECSLAQKHTSCLLTSHLKPRWNAAFSSSVHAANWSLLSLSCSENFCSTESFPETVSGHCGEFFELDVEIYPTHVMPFLWFPWRTQHGYPTCLHFWRAHSSCTRSLFFLYTALLFNSVSCRCQKSEENSPKSSLVGSCILCFGKKKRQQWLSVQSSERRDPPLHLTGWHAEATPNSATWWPLTEFPRTNSERCEIGKTCLEQILFNRF